MAHGQTLGRKYSAQKPNPAPIRLHHTMAGRSGLNPLPGSTAGCGKPHVRWCGRVTARNHRDPTRSREAATLPECRTMSQGVAAGNSSLPFFWMPKKFPDPRLLNCPEGKRFALFQTRIAVINQLQSALMTGAHQRLIFPKLQGVE